jgi:hypothetical protein
MKLGAGGREGLPLAHRDDLVPYESLQFGGWDVNGDDLAKAAHVHRVLEPAQIEAVGEVLSAIEPWPAVADPAFCRNAVGGNVVAIEGLRDRVERIRATCARSGPTAGSTASSSSTWPPPRRGRTSPRPCWPTRTRSRRVSTPTPT